jgi:putative transposase
VECIRKSAARIVRPPPVHDDFVERDFTAGTPNQLWFSDITEHRTGEGKLYPCAIKDAFSNRIVGYNIDSRMKSRLATTAVSSAVARRGNVAGCTLHSDRSQYRSRKFVLALNHNGMVGSMGRVRPATTRPWKASSVCTRRTSSTAPLGHPGRTADRERTYHRRRRQLALGRLTPIEFEAIMTTPAGQAA